MFQISKPAPNRLDLELSGTIDADAMRAALDDLIEKSADIEHGRMLYVMPEMAWPTLSAFAVEMSRVPKLFGLLSHFERAAVLSDAGWIKSIAEFKGAIFPGIEIRGFDMSEKAAAEAWLAEPHL